uniref:ATP synthase subunit f, mitochondrial n=1 Tax=Pavo cristatus TaxID=9049 RepID=A0A8C9FHU5_PAVCR
MWLFRFDSCTLGPVEPAHFVGGTIQASFLSSLKVKALGDLPMWLTTCDFSPRGLLGGVSYYNKYINVKRGGAAGISMLLAGYCVLSYSWNYQHIKCSRWRKYH